MRLTLKEAINKANTFDTLSGLQEALGLTDVQIAIRLDCEIGAWKGENRNRKDWLRALRWLLVEKWLHDEEVTANKIGLDDSETLYEGDTPENGKIALARWPEGFVLRYHGGIVWRSWSPASKDEPIPVDDDLNERAALITLKNFGIVEQGNGLLVQVKPTPFPTEIGRALGYLIDEFDMTFTPWGEQAAKPEPAEPTDQDLVNAMHRHMMAIRELRAQLYARDIKIEFSAQSEAANNPWVYARFTKQMAPKDS